jgi:hypothetical protein
MQRDLLDRVAEFFSIRERVAFTLGMAQCAARALAGAPALFTAARHALDAAWQWQTSPSLSGDELVYEHLMREDERGLANLSLPNGRECDAVNAVVSALFYVAWHADGQAGIRFPAEPVNESGEDNVELTLKYAFASGELTQDLVNRLFEAIRRAPTASEYPRYYAAHALGGPVDRALIDATLPLPKV